MYLWRPDPFFSSKAFHGNPYDGHTLNENLSHAEKIVAGKGLIKEAFADRGYRGHDYAGEAKVHIVKNIGKQKQPLKKWMKRRSVIEADIGFMKRENRLGCNYLKGITGDQINAAFAAIGKNMRILLREISFLFFLPEFILAVRSFLTQEAILKTNFLQKTTLLPQNS
jgi:IS5 family transposase